MKLKSYMRGLGIGIVVTALIMGIATKSGRPLTDAEIKAAAAKLGMVERESLKLTDLDQSGAKPESSPSASPTPEVSAAPEPTPSASPTPEVSAAPEPTPSASPTPEVSAAPEPTPSASPTPEVSAAPEPTPSASPTPEVSAAPESSVTAASPTQAPEDASDGDTVKIVVQRGNGSRAVCNQLAAAGLIADAAAFDQYLIDSGYSKRISAGTFEIPAGASEEEIAKIISRSR
ncbi:MAG: hypothetical protein NC123_01195 [Butyrivibrio sp.]|nr:hypothetical protein [Butyrivibrio sp.]